MREDGGVATTVTDTYGLGDVPGWKDVDWDAHVRTISVRGCAVTYVDMGSGDGPPLVLLHGFGGCWQNWLETIPRLAEHRRVIALDLPGFGGSALPREVLTPAYFAGVVDRFCEKLELGPVVLVGNSLGGLVATIVAGRTPARVERLVLVAAVGGVHLARVALDAGPKILALQTFPLVRRTPMKPARHPLTAILHAPRKLSPALLRAALLPGNGKPGVPLASFGIALQSIRHANLHGLMRRITAPTLLLWGGDDQLVPVRSAATFAREIASAELVVLPDTGHIPQLERPRDVNRLLLDFIA